MSAKRYSPAISRRMAELRCKGWTYCAIAILYACSEATVIRHCRKHSAAPPGGNRPTPDPVLELIRRRQKEARP